MMTVLFIFMKRYWLWILIVIAIVFLGRYVYTAGQRDVQEEWDASIARGLIEVAKLKEKQVVVTTKVETVYVDRVKTIREKSDAIETVREVFVPVDSGNLGGGFRLFHDAAVTGVIPESASITDAAAVPIADVAETVSANYERCHVAYATVDGLQEWIRAQQKLSP